MPTYEYACTTCAQHTEVVQSMSDAPLTECASCGGTLRKVFSPIGIVFKGSGFYKTDSRSSGRGAAKPAEPTGPKTESTADAKPAKTDAKSETKSDAKADAKPAGTAPVAKSA